MHARTRRSATAGGAQQHLSCRTDQLKPGVTLLVEANAALFASRNPRDYDMTPGSCGVVGKRGRGCKSLITVDDAPGSGIMGDGSIDGRGGAKLDRAERDLVGPGETAKVLDQSQSRAAPDLGQPIRWLHALPHHAAQFAKFPCRRQHTNGFTAWGVKIRTPRTARNTDGIDPVVVHQRHHHSLRHRHRRRQCRDQDRRSGRPRT